MNIRDELAAEFRRDLYARTGFVPFPHQAEWQCALDGWTLHHGPLVKPGRETDTQRFIQCRLENRSLAWFKLTPREDGRARVAAELAGFKAGKSWGAGTWAAGFAGVPDCEVVLIGIEYDMCTPEFNRIVECLLSSSGMNLTPKRFKNDPDNQNMFLELRNGARFYSGSWRRKHTFRGKAPDVYIICEGYQFPGPQVYNSISQNLREKDGIFVFTTTPDEPWVSFFHERAHGHDPEFHCTCEIPSESNPYTFRQVAKDRDDPKKGGLKGRHEFAVSWLGKLGHFIGSVYAYRRGERRFTPATHPEMWRSDVVDRWTKGEIDVLDLTRDDLALQPNGLALPYGFEVVSAVQTGSRMGAVIAAVSPSGAVFVIDEAPNYTYVSKSPELLELSIRQWATVTAETIQRYGGKLKAFSEPGDPFRRELRRYGLKLRGNTTKLAARTEIAREYFIDHQVFFAPWLVTLPYEVEIAKYPTDVDATGEFSRIEQHDQTLKCLEHVLSRRERGFTEQQQPRESFKDRYIRENRLPGSGNVDVHLGKL